ncbi:MAG: TIM barrel protein [Chloroflexota bacterium]|nr:TIM barrel protein [Chloroflexota bacterium]
MAFTDFKFGTVGTPRSTPKKPGGTIGTIRHLAKLELLAFEIGWVRSVRVSEKTCAAIKKTADELGMHLSVHAPYYINLNADKEEWPKGRKRLMDAAFYGNLAGATDIVFHPGSYFGQPPEDVLPLAIQRLQGCVDEIRNQGNLVVLRPETMGKGALLGSLDDTLELSKEIEGVEPCLDFAHLHARAGDGSINSYTEWVEILERYEKYLGEQALTRLHCHLSGIEYGPKGERNHLMLKDSDFNLDALLRALNAFNCGGRVLCESPQDMDVDALHIMEVWKKA